MKEVKCKSGTTIWVHMQEDIICMTNGEHTAQPSAQLILDALEPYTNWLDLAPTVKIELDDLEYLTIEKDEICYISKWKIDVLGNPVKFVFSLDEFWEAVKKWDEYSKVLTASLN